MLTSYFLDLEKSLNKTIKFCLFMLFLLALLAFFGMPFKDVFFSCTCLICAFCIATHCKKSTAKEAIESAAALEKFSKNPKLVYDFSLKRNLWNCLFADKDRNVANVFSFVGGWSVVYSFLTNFHTILEKFKSFS